MPLAPTSFREEGVGQPRIEADWRKSPPLSVGAISATMRKYLGRYTKHFKENERIYANIRARAGTSPKPRYILSDIGIVSNNGINKDKFSWMYLPPVGGAYNVTPQGKIRPWTYIFFHSFGYIWDRYHMGLSRHKGRRGLRKVLAPPGDEFGHHPSRWFAGVKEMTKNPELSRGAARKVSIHFCISRRGDVIVSTDLNDIAWHGGGRFIHPRNNNIVSVGFELEPQRIRLKPYGRAITAPFTTPQMTALAIVCKKLDTWRPTKQVYITRRSATSHNDFAQTKRLAQQHGSGYIQHSDVSPVYVNSAGKRRGGKVDAGAQFNILPGEKARIGSAAWHGEGINSSNGDGDWRGSGWTELWELMKRVRKFRAADQLFVTSIPSVEFALMKEFAEALQKSNSGQRSVLTAAQDRVAGLRRAANMQSRKRRATYAKAMTHGTALSTTVALTTAAVSKVLASFDTSNLKAPTGDVLTYDYETGTWRVGGTDSGSA
ncbi:MAG: N-acetylmuramoyl-L-alanine amidase [Planctomycetota bacterium]|jgi:hypothetical protein